MASLIILGAVALLTLWVYVCKEFSNIAHEKGYVSSRYFWWTFFLSLFGIMMVVALPDRGTQRVVEASDKAAAPAELTEELPDI